MRLTTVIICFLFIIVALMGFVISCIGLLLPGIIVTLLSLIGIYAAVNIKK